MGFRVKLSKALQVESDRVESIILMPKYWRRVWTSEELCQELNALGLDYKLEEVERINDELHRRGVVEDVR